jgi:deoxyribonucleoside regulator
MSDNTRLLAKVATLYYKGQLSQAEVADRLGLSRQSVGRLIQRAHETGVVRIEIQSPLARETELEAALEEKFKLVEAVVVSPAASTDDALRAAIGEGAAEFLQRRLKADDILGVVSGSTTINEVAAHLRPTHVPNLTVVGLTGSMPPRSPVATHAESIVHRYAKALGGKPIMLAAPSFVDNAKIQKALLSDSNIASVLKLGDEANIALFGVGVLSRQSTQYREGLVEYDWLRKVTQQGGVGEASGYAYDIEGRLCSPDLNARTIALELTKMRNKPISAAIAGGAHKLDAIWGVLQGKYCNVLITDDETARALLNRASRTSNTATKKRGNATSKSARRDTQT